MMIHKNFCIIFSNDPHIQTFLEFISTATHPSRPLIFAIAALSTLTPPQSPASVVGNPAIVADIVRGSLGGMSGIVLHGESFVQISAIFRGIFTDDLFAKIAPLLPWTPNLARSPGPGPASLHLMLQVLRARIPNKFSTEGYADWIVGQIREARDPLHPLLVNLVEEFVGW